MEFIDNLMPKILNFFDVNQKAKRTEFNYSILIYSLVLISLAGCFLYFYQNEIKTVNDALNKEIILPLYEQKINEAQAVKLFETFEQERLGFIPVTLFCFLPLFLIPLYLRRLKDIGWHQAFAAPIILLYLLDFINAAFKTEITFFFADTMAVYNFVLVMLLCCWPSKQQ